MGDWWGETARSESKSLYSQPKPLPDVSNGGNKGQTASNDGSLAATPMIDECHEVGWGGGRRLVVRLLSLTASHVKFQTTSFAPVAIISLLYAPFILVLNGPNFGQASKRLLFARASPRRFSVEQIITYTVVMRQSPECEAIFDFVTRQRRCK